MSGNRRVTLADIATRAEVHVTTVSLALRNHPRLPEKTRTRIQKLAKEMGYQPDPVLQALVAYRGKVMERRNPPTLAYITNWDTKLGWQKTTAHPEFYEGAKSKAEELGFKLDHFWMGEPGLSHTRMSKILQARGITGVLIASHRRASDVSLGTTSRGWASSSPSPSDSALVDFAADTNEIGLRTNALVSICGVGGSGLPRNWPGGGGGPGNGYGP